MDDLRKEFQNVYKAHDIDLFGAWVDEDNPSVSYYITRYKDESDYKEKVEQLHKDERYMKLTDQLKEIRTNSSSTRLSPKW